MKIRIMGTKAECEAMTEFFAENISSEAGYSVSGLYANRGNTNLYRICIELAVAPSSIGKKRLQAPEELRGMINQDVLDFMSLFSGSFINRGEELILDPNTNLYFSIKQIKTKTDLYKKIISACSRDACKTAPYGKEHLNEQYQKKVRDRLNSFLNVHFSEEEWMLIYTYLGNGCNGDLCDKFIESGFDLQIIKEYDLTRRGSTT